MSKFLTSVCTYNPPTTPPNPKTQNIQRYFTHQIPYDAKKGANLTFAHQQLDFSIQSTSILLPTIELRPYIMNSTIPYTQKVFISTNFGHFR